METQFKLNTIEEAIEDFRQGKIVIVVDDQDRENEGDFVAAGEKVTPEMINFMTKAGRGLVCAPITRECAEALELPVMVEHNTDAFGTAFTISVDKAGDGVTTGISAADRAKTIVALSCKDSTPSTFNRPGHIFPLIAKDGGVLYRTGHTEAVVDLARLAGLKPAGVLIEIMNEDGTMARLPELMEVSKKHGIKIISIEDLIAYRVKSESLVEAVEQFDLSCPDKGLWQVKLFRDKISGAIHLAACYGDWEKAEGGVPVKVTRINPYLNALDLLKEEGAPYMDIIRKNRAGVVVMIAEDAQRENFLDRIRSLKGNGRPIDLCELRPAPDNKVIGIGASIIKSLGIKQIRLVSRSNFKRVGLSGYGIAVKETIGY